MRDRGAFTTTLLAEHDNWQLDARRLGAGLALAAIYGIAIGARYGPLSMAVHAAGAPIALAAVAALATPAFYIGVAHADLPISLNMLRGAVARGVATVGLVLAGIAPLVMLIAVTAEEPVSAAIMAAVGLAGAGYLGLDHMVSELTARLGDIDRGRKRRAKLVCAGFAIFAMVLAARVWWLVLPMLGRASV